MSARASALAAAVVVLLASLDGCARGSSGDERERAFSRAGSTRLADSVSPLAMGAPPERYRIEYRRESLAGDDTTSTETLVVQRPFDSRVDATGAFVRRSAFGVLANESPGGEDAVLAIPPALAAGDLRPDVALPAALTGGLVGLGERRRVAGRPCQVYRSGKPFTSGEIAPFDAAAPERAEGCFDEDGLLLEELWWLDDRATERLVAVGVDTSPHVSSSDLAIVDKPTGAVEKGNGSIHEVAPESRLPGGTFHELQGVPSRFEHRGRYAVVWPGSSVHGDSERIASLVDAWTDGADVLLFERGGSRYGSAVLEPPAWASRETVPGVGEVSVVLGLRGNDVRLFPRKGEVVRITGTLPPAELLHLAAGIVETDAGPIVELPGASTGA